MELSTQLTLLELSSSGLVSSIDTAIEQLAKHGYVIIPNFLDREATTLLLDYAQNLAPQYWQQAGIGRADHYTTNTQIRQDRIRWLHADEETERGYLEIMSALKQRLNRELFMGLFDYECHLAHYPLGAFYRRHLDAFKGRSNRVLSTVFYLNEEWQPNDGGQLVIYGKKNEVLETILPTAGTLVLFLSDIFVHEVLEGKRDRYSITGWFRMNNSIGGVVDPNR